MTETFLQHHGWVLVSLLGGLLVTLMLLLGAQIHLVNYHLGTLQKQAVLKATGRKWIFAFAVFVVLGVTVYAAFPLFFRVAFWGARWLWALLLVTLFIQLIAYAICNKTEKPLGSTFFCIILMLNGALAPLLVGTFIGSFFTGAGFYVNRTVVPATATWVSPLRGLDLLTQPHALLLGLVAVALSYILGAMYVIRVVDDHPVRKVMRRSVRNMAVPFLLLAMVWFALLMLRPGFSVDADGIMSRESYKYFMNLLHHGQEITEFTLGILLVLAGFYFCIKKKSHRKGFWLTAAGTMLVVMGVFFLAGFHGTAYYPSLTIPQSSLTLRNSSASFETLHSLFWVSLLIPISVIGLGYVWHRADHKKKVTVRDREGKSHSHSHSHRHKH